MRMSIPPQPQAVAYPSQIDDATFSEAVSMCSSWNQVARRLGIANSTKVRVRLIQRAMHLGLDFSAYRRHTNLTAYARMTQRDVATMVFLEVQRIEQRLAAAQAHHTIPPELIISMQEARRSAERWQEEHLPPR